MHRSRHKILREPVLKLESKESSDLDNPPHSKRARLQRSADRATRKLTLEWDTEDSTDIDDPDCEKKAKLPESSSGIPRERVFESDTDDSDDFDDPTWGENAKWPRSSTGVPQKTALGSTAVSGQNAQSRQPQEEKHRGSGSSEGKVGRDSISVIREPCEEEKNAAQAIKGCKETLETVTGSSYSTQQAERPAEEPHYEIRTLAPPFRKPDSKMRNSAYKCSVTGCPHGNDEQSPTGLWLFTLPDETNEASLRSEWLQHVPIDNNVNRPLSPRVCFKHFDARKHFVSAKHRILGLKLDAVPNKLLQPLKTPRKGKRSNTFRRLPQLPQCASGTNLGQVSTSTTGVEQKPRPMTAAREARKLQSTTCATVMQEPQSTTSIDVAEEAQSTAAGAAQESQPPATPVLVQETKCVTSADVDVECHSVTASGAAHELQSTTATAPLAMVQESRSTTSVDASSVSQPVETDEEARKLQSTTTATDMQEQHSSTTFADVAAGQSLMAAGVAQELQPTATSTMVQESQSMSSADVSSEYQPVGTDEEAQKLHSTITATIAQKSQSVTLADVAAETQPMTTAGVAQESQYTCAATVVQESQSTTFDDVSSQSQPVAFHEQVQSHTTVTATTAQESQSMISVNVTGETEPIIAAGVTQESQPTATATMVQESLSTTFDNVNSESQPVEADGETQKLQSTISATMVQEPQSVTSADITSETQSMTAAGVTRESQSTATVDMVQELQSMTLASRDAETWSITATGAPQELESTATTGMELQGITTAVVQEPQSMTSENIGVQSQFLIASGAAQELQPTTTGSQSMCTAVVQKSQSTTFADVSVKSAEVVQELQSKTTATKLMAPEAKTFADWCVESQPAAAAGTAQESQSTTNAAMFQEPESMALAKVAAQTESITAAEAAQAVQSTASTTTELHSTTTAAVMEAPQSALPDVAAEVQVMTTAPEVQEPQSAAAAATPLQFATATSIKQKPQSVAVADVTVESQSATAAGTAQELLCATSDAMIQEPQSMALAKVAAETESITAAEAAQGVQSTAFTATELHSSTTAAVMEAPQSALPDVAAEVQVMTTAPEVQEPQSAAATPLQSATATSMKQKPQSVTVADGDMERDSMTAVGEAQESQSVLKEEPQVQALPDVPADTVSMTVAPEAGESESTNAAAMVQEPDSVTDGIGITESKVVAAAGATQESHYMTVTGVELKTAATVAREHKLQPMTFANLGAEFQSGTAAEAAQKPQSTMVAAMKPDLATDSLGQEPQRKVLFAIPEPQSATAIDVGCKSQSRTVAPMIINHLNGQESQSATTIGIRDELESTAVVASEHEFQSVMGTGKRKECELMSVVDTVQKLHTATAVGVESESQCANSTSPITELAAESKSKSKAKFWLHFPDSDDESEAEEQNVADIPTSPASVRTESFEEATDCCPAVITEPNHQTDDRNTGTCNDLPSGSSSEKYTSKSAPMQATSVSDKLVEQAEEIASYLATHGPVDYVDESTVSICASPSGSCDSDDEKICKQVTSIPNKALVPLTQDISMANTEMSSTVPNKLLEFDLQTQQQALKNAVASSPPTKMFSASKPTDTNERMVKRGTNVNIERDDPAPPCHVASRRSSASTCAVNTALEKPPASDVRTEAPLPREIVVPSAAALSRSLGNLTNSRNRAMERNQRDSIREKGLPHFSPQSCSSAQKGDRHVTSRAVSAPVVKATIDKSGQPAVSTEPIASCSEPAWRHRLDLPGRSSAVAAEKAESIKGPSAGHVFHPSQGRYILKKEVLQDGDEFGMSAVLCTVVWVPTGSDAKT
uniref:Cell surface glycoprotein n=1 Tax=Rhipicephalus zambeziensis TaxID=60191 RepID=A0A224YLJ9_9ACAR